MKITFSGTDDLHALLGDLEKTAEWAPRDARAVIKKGAQQIKTDAQRRISGLAHAPAYPRSISYDTHETPGGGWAEIGPDKDKRQGALGNLLEYGSIRNAPIPHLAPALEDERPRLQRALQELAGRILDK